MLSWKHRCRLVIVGTLLTNLVACYGKAERDGDTMTPAGVSLPKETLGWQLVDSLEIYDRESIFKYIDGAGEVYNAYQFHQVYVQRLVRSDHAELLVEMFDMTTPEEAYGVFSYTREQIDTTFGQGAEQRGGTICFWKGRWYVCVATYDDSDEANQALTSLARAVDKQLPVAGSRPEIVDMLPPDNLKLPTIRYFHVHPVLNYHYYLAQDNILGLSSQTEVALAEYESNTGYLMVIKYPHQEAAEEAQLALKKVLASISDVSREAVRTDVFGWTRVVTRGNYLVFVFEAATADQATELADTCASRINQKPTREAM